MLPTIVAELGYPNSGGIPGEVLLYPCPLGCGRQHFTVLPNGQERALTTPPCGGGMARRRPFVVVLPPPDHRLSEAPLDQWRADFETERRRVRGGRPKKQTVA